jgi:HSP20 family molecular chaperone IbpA
LNQDVEVAGANFNDGILTISLEHIIPEERKPKTIAIKKQFLQE